jgi:hypothetical protein
VRFASLIALAAAGFASLASPRASYAHLVVTRGGLISLVAHADGVVVARAEAATAFDASRGVARTPFRALGPIAGEGPTGEFVVETPDRTALRHVAGQTEIVFVRRPATGGAAWETPQEAGLGIVLEGEAASAATLEAVRGLWSVGRAQATAGSAAAASQALATRVSAPAAVGAAPLSSRDGSVQQPAPPGSKAVTPPSGDSRVWGRALLPALRAPERKLRVLAVLDFAALAHAPGDLDDATIAALAAYGAAPGDDTALRPALDAVVGALQGRGS